MRLRRSFVALFVAAALALLLTSCAWGLVTDSQTGQAVPGAQVTFHDSEGGSGTTSANEDGLYAFELNKGPIPAEGMVTYEVTAPGYEPLTVQREVQYDDNAAGTWEIQDFALSPETGRYYNEEEGFSIEFPPDWEVIDGFLAELMGAIVYATSPLEGPDDWFQENVLVLTEELPFAGMNPEAYLDIGLGTFRRFVTESEGLFSDFREHERGQVTIDNKDAPWVIYSYRLETPFESVGIKGLMYVLVKGRQAYVIACGAQSERFRTYRSTFEEVAESFRFE